LVDDVRLQRRGDGGRAVVLHLGLDRDGAGGTRVRRQGGRRDPGAVPGDAQRIGDDYEHVAVDATLEGVITRQQRQLRVPLVVQSDRDDVVTGLDRRGDVDRKPVVPAD